MLLLGQILPPQQEGRVFVDVWPGWMQLYCYSQMQQKDPAKVPDPTRTGDPAATEPRPSYIHVSLLPAALHVCDVLRMLILFPLSSLQRLLTTTTNSNTSGSEPSDPTCSFHSHSSLSSVLTLLSDSRQSVMFAHIVTMSCSSALLREPKL